MSHMSLSEFMFEASAHFSYDVHNFSCVVKLTKGKICLIWTHSLLRNLIMFINKAYKSNTHL